MADAEPSYPRLSLASLIIATPCSALGLTCTITDHWLPVPTNPNSKNVLGQYPKPISEILSLW